MADQKITDLDADISPAAGDLIPIVKDPGGTPTNETNTRQVFLDWIEANGAAPASFITSDTFADARIAETSVTQHQGALSITESQISDLQSYLLNVVEDTTPQLGGALDVNGQKIVSVSNGNIDLEPNGTGNVLIGNLTVDADQSVGAGQDNFLLGYDHGTGLIALRAQTQAIVVAASDETSNLAIGNAVITFRMPYAFKLTGVKASVTTAPTGAAITADVNKNGISIFSTKITIDATEKTSATADTPSALTTTDLADDDEITVDIDGIGSTVAGAGLKIYLLGYPT